jgi:hypothetical protein
MQTQPQRTYTVMGRAVRVPVEVARASAVSATYLASAARVRDWIADSGLRVLEPVPGRTLLSVAGLCYEQGDWGRYDELCMAVPVIAPELASGRASSWRALRSGRLGLYLRYLPVTDEFSCRAGVELYGFPKWLADIELTASPREMQLGFASDGREVLALRVRCGEGRRSFAPLSIDAYSHRDGALRRCRFTVAGEGVGVRAGGAELKLGSHAIADELRTLRLSRHALCVARIARMRASFGVPENVRHTP